MNEDILQIRISVEQMKFQLHNAFSMHCDKMKDIFKEKIEAETKNFLETGLEKLIKSEVRDIVLKEIYHQVEIVVNSHKQYIKNETEKSIKENKELDMKKMLREALLEMDFSFKNKDSDY